MKKDEPKKKGAKMKRADGQRGSRAGYGKTSAPVKTGVSNRVEKDTVGTAATAKFSFFKIEVACISSFLILKDMFAYFGYETTDESSTTLEVTDGTVNISVFYGSNMSGSDMYVINSGINCFFLEVLNKEAVDTFKEKFLDPRCIECRPGEENKYQRHFQEGSHSLFFDLREKITIGIISK